MTAIEKLKDLTKTGMDELIKSLLTYEIKRKLKEEEVKVKRDIVLKVGDEKEEERNSFIDEDDLSLLVRKFSQIRSY